LANLKDEIDDIQESIDSVDDPANLLEDFKKKTAEIFELQDTIFKIKEKKNPPSPEAPYEFTNIKFIAKVMNYREDTVEQSKFNVDLYNICILKY
jgi:hypothetical protein